MTHPCPPPASRKMKDYVSSLRYVKVAPGLRHATLEARTHQGPLRASVLRMDSRRFHLATWHHQPDRPESFEEAARRSGSVAAFSGGFYLDSGADIAPPGRRFDPVGLRVQDGVVVSPPVFRRGSLLQDHNGHVAIRAVGMRDVVLRWGDARKLQLFEGPAGIQGISRPTVVHRTHGEQCPPLDGSKISIVGQQVMSLTTGRAAVPIPLNGFVLMLPPNDLWSRLAEDLGNAGTVTYEMAALAGLDAIVSAVAGGPILLAGGQLRMDLASEDFAPMVPPFTCERDGSLGHDPQARLAVGLTPAKELVVVAVDGHDPHRSLGLTLRDLAELTRALGCVDSLNLSGGSFKRMLVGTETVDLPGTPGIADSAASSLRQPVPSGILVLQKLHGDLPAT